MKSKTAKFTDPSHDMASHHEIERKFLIKDLPFAVDQFPHNEIMQGYYTEHGVDYRIRKQGDQYFRTVKTGEGLIRQEDEIAITQEEFDQRRPSVGKLFLEKTRYYIPYNNAQIELDLYKNLQGLTTAEVEFSSAEEANNFTPPERCALELTGMEEATNVYLATHGVSEKLLKLMK